MTDILLISAILIGMINMYLIIFKMVWRKELEQTVTDLLNQVVDMIKLKERTQKFISKLIATRKEKL